MLTQVGINYESKVNGMSYILRTPTGSFIVIDGGLGRTGRGREDTGLLKEQQAGDGKPRSRPGY